MNSKGIKQHLTRKVNDWISTIEDKDLVVKLKHNIIVTGGALVSLLNGEEPNDYDIYIKSYGVLKDLAKYYASVWNDSHPDKKPVTIQSDDEDEELKDKIKPEDYRVRCFIKSAGVVKDENDSAIDDDSEPLPNEYYTEPYTSENEENPTQPDPTIEKPKYRPRYFSTNAITLSDKIQLVIRFWGPVEEIHKNYDFIHCTCSFDYETGKVNLPVEALECIINKELRYVGSRYPLCSIIRTRKYIKRGYSINAGQYLKMCLQLNELDLTDLNVFKDQLTGVDSAYFDQAITYLMKRKEQDPEFKVTTPYLIEVINKIF